MIKYAKISLLMLIFYATPFVSQASILDNVKSGFSGIISVIKNNIIQKVEGDFCNQYILSVSNGSWKQDEFRVKLGKNICSKYKGSNETVPVSIVNFSFLPKTNIVPSTKKENLADNNVVDTDTNTGNSNIGGNQIIFWTNSERNKNGGLTSLSGNKLLSQIAKIRVDDMFAKGYFEHVSPSGDSASKEAESVGYKFITIGENIALGNFNGAEGLVDAWMASPGHRANILNKNYTEIGVASEEGMYNGQKVSISAQIFGKPLSLCESPNESIKTQISNYKNSAENLFSSMTQIKNQLNTLTGTTKIEKAAEYNSDASLYNNLITEMKKLTIEYNNQVTVFNNCVKTF